MVLSPRLASFGFQRRKSVFLSTSEAKRRSGRYLKDLITSKQFITMWRGAITESFDF